MNIHLKIRSTKNDSSKIAKILKDDNSIFNHVRIIPIKNCESSINFYLTADCNETNREEANELINTLSNRFIIKLFYKNYFMTSYGAK